MRYSWIFGFLLLLMGQTPAVGQDNPAFQHQAVLECMDAIGDYIYQLNDDKAAMRAVCQSTGSQQAVAEVDYYRDAFGKKSKGLLQLCHAEWRGYWNGSLAWLTPGDDPEQDHFVQQQMRNILPDLSPLEQEIVFRAWLDDATYYKLWFSGNKDRPWPGGTCYSDYVNRLFYQDDTIAFLENNDVAERMVQGEFSPRTVSLVAQIIRNMIGRVDVQAAWIRYFEDNKDKLGMDERWLKLLHKFHEENKQRAANFETARLENTE